MISQIAYYRVEAIEHLEENELYYARTAINMAISVYEKQLEGGI